MQPPCLIDPPFERWNVWIGRGEIEEHQRPAQNKPWSHAERPAAEVNIVLLFRWSVIFFLDWRLYYEMLNRRRSYWCVTSIKAISAINFNINMSRHTKKRLYRINQKHWSLSHFDSFLLSKQLNQTPSLVFFDETGHLAYVTGTVG